MSGPYKDREQNNPDLDPGMEIVAKDKNDHDHDHAGPGSARDELRLPWPGVGRWMEAADDLAQRLVGLMIRPRKPCRMAGKSAVIALPEGYQSAPGTILCGEFVLHVPGIVCDDVEKMKKAYALAKAVLDAP